MKSPVRKKVSVKAMEKKRWRKELRGLIASATLNPILDILGKTNPDEAAEKVVVASRKIIRYVEKLIAPTLPKKRK